MTKKIVILGGGFGGVYTAMHLEKQLRKNKGLYEIILVNRENYFVFQPMLAEVIGGSVDLLDTINSLRRLLPRSTLFIRDIESIDLDKKRVMLSPKFSHTPFALGYDHLVFALGNVTDFRGTAGLHEHALPFKNLADTLAIRNQLIDVLEAASTEKNPALRKKLLTFVVGGGGFSGTEVVAEVNDFVRALAKKYPSIDRKEIRVILVHSKDRIMDREMSASLGHYAAKILKKRGVEIFFNTLLISATPEEAVLNNNQRIPCKTIISTVPCSPNLLIEPLKLPFEKGKIITDAGMQVKGHTDLWALGDCAAIPNLNNGGICPPTAQFAIREAKILAHNLVVTLTGGKKKEFRFKALGMMGALGHRRAVAELFGKFKFSGILAWMLWRLIYWIKLPGADRKLKVAIAWFLDILLPIEAVQIKTASEKGIAELHFEIGEVIFHQGDIGDYLYIIVRGEVEVFITEKGKEKVVAKLGQGQYFGEMALLNQRSRSASVRCLSAVDVLALKKSDFGVLIANFAELRKDFEATEQKRKEEIEKIPKNH